ncbi:MAG: SAM-dependent methyltransferase [Tannerella sp.]|nr:SAM-dependent methyltransferase [Tannerella sp.]
MTDTLRKFIRDHAEDDLSELLLSAFRYKGVDVKAAVGQIKARNRIKDKIPSWYHDDRLFFPSILATEQCSSEITALYKRRFVRNDDRLCDLTGGLGVDAYFFSQKVKRVTYVEQNGAYCDAARYNLNLLGVSNVCVVNCDAVEFVTGNYGHIADINVFYMDPARRGAGNRRMFAISDCEPDLTKIWTLLQGRYKVIVKLSPMLDLTQLLKQLPEAREVHIVSVKNDCKELLIIAGGLPPESGSTDLPDKKPDPEIICINYTADGMEQSFRFHLSDERSAVVSLAGNMGRYLYEPNSSVLKAGAYKSAALRYGVEKLHASSHLYTSDHPIPSFSGRIFEIAEIIPFSSRTCKTLASDIPRANISVRNFPLPADELRKRMRIADGGSAYLFATTLSDNKKVLIKCRKVYP